jgi:hypothetical protein
MGRHEVGFLENVVKVPAGETNDGCRFEATFQVNKVPGNFHMSTHSAESQPVGPNMLHIVHGVIFGQRLEVDAC